MDLNIAVPGKKAAKTVSVSDDTFGKEFNESLVHQVVVTYMAGSRQGTVKQKTRSEVGGGGKKAMASERDWQGSRRNLTRTAVAYWWCYLCCKATRSLQKN